MIAQFYYFMENRNTMDVMSPDQTAKSKFGIEIDKTKENDGSGS